MTVYRIYAINIGQHVCIYRTITGLHIGICVHVAYRSWRHGMYIIIHVGVWMLLIKEYLCMSQLYNILLYIL